MSNSLLFNSEARVALLRGLNIVADAVGATLGPKGRNVAIEQGRTDIGPLVVHDGVTVARRIVLKDPFENMGAQALKEAAQKTSDRAGDGTTTATILAQAIVNEAIKQIETGTNPQTLKKEIEESLKIVLSELQKLVKKVTSHEELEHIATIASADKELGKMVAEAVKKVGKEGAVTVEEGQGFETTIEYKQGMEIDRGYLSPYFVTDQSRVEAVIEKPYILLTDLKISHNFEIVPFMEKLMKAGIKDIVIFASTVDDEALATLVVNKLRGIVNVLAVQAPAFGGRRIDELEDMATLTGGQVVTLDSGRELESVQVEELGRADKIISDRDKTIILNGRGAKKAIKQRIEELKKQITVANTDYDKDIKRERMAKLAGEIAIIHVGGTTEVELKEKRLRVVNAKNATKAAIEDGIVAGGEISLLRLSKQNDILFRALKQPFKKLLENAGLDYAEARQQLGIEPYPYGIDIMDGQVKNLIEAGIIDPIKVVRLALENAVSVACMIITCSCIIVEEKDEK